MPEVTPPPAVPLLAPEDYPRVDHLVTEDDTPVDNIFSEKQQRLLTEPLYTSWKGPEDRGQFLALANVGLFFAVKQPPIIPDVLLSLDVEVPADLWPKANRSYFVWEYGKLPDAVIEVVSNREGGEDTTKLRAYARIRIPYYIIFDPERQLGSEILRGYQLRGLAYEPMTGHLWLPLVGLGLILWQGTYENHTDTWLRWCDADQRPIPTGAEAAEQETLRAEEESQRADIEKGRADQHKQRADQEKQRADQEKLRADQEKQRADRLADQLRTLGMDPDTVPPLPASGTGLGGEHP